MDINFSVVQIFVSSCYPQKLNKFYIHSVDYTMKIKTCKIILVSNTTKFKPLKRPPVRYVYDYIDMYTYTAAKPVIQDTGK